MGNHRYLIDVKDKAIHTQDIQIPHLMKTYLRFLYLKAPWNDDNYLTN